MVNCIVLHYVPCLLQQKSLNSTTVMLQRQVVMQSLRSSSDVLLSATYCPAMVKIIIASPSFFSIVNQPRECKKARLPEHAPQSASLPETTHSGKPPRGTVRLPRPLLPLPALCHPQTRGASAAGNDVAKFNSVRLECVTSACHRGRNSDIFIMEEIV